MDFGSSGVKAVGLAAEGDRIALLGAGREPLGPGSVADGVVRDPEAAGAALARLLPRTGTRCRVLGLSVGGSSVFIKRLPTPVRDPDSPESFREAVAREAAPHVPFHIESLEFDYELGPGGNAGKAGTGERSPSLVFGAAPRETVRSHCDAASRAGREVARVELEPYALFSAAVLEAELRTAPAGSGPRLPVGYALVEIGAHRTGVHLFRRAPQKAAPPPDPAAARSAPGPAWLPGDLLASVALSGVGAEAALGAGGEAAGPAVSETGSAAGRDASAHPPEEREPGPDRVAAASRRIEAALGEALREAGLSPPVVVRLSGGGAPLPGIAASVGRLALGTPTPLDPLRGFDAGPRGPEFAVAAGLALQQLPERTAPAVEGS